MSEPRNRFTRTSSLMLALSLALGGCGVGTVDAENGVADNNSELVQDITNTPWEVIRKARQKKLDDYLAAHPAEFAAFRDGVLGTSGVPKLIFDKFTTVFPDLWGAPTDSLAKLGFTKNPWAPEGSLPLGLGKVTDPATGLELVTLSCGGCHMGKVKGPDGKLIHIIGGANTQFNQFRTAVERTVVDPRFDAVFSPTPLAPVAAGLKTKVIQRRDLINATLGGYTFSPARFPNAPDLNTLSKPGYLDAIGVALVSLVAGDVVAGNFSTIPLVMPPRPAQVDIPSVWRQSSRDLAQWDGSIPNPVYRNLAAEIGVIGIPSAVSYSNAKASSDFVEALPSAPYPFEVNALKAAAGAVLYGKYCVSCHKSDGVKRFSAADVGTDPNRTFTVTPDNRSRLIAVMRASCTEPAVCDVPDDEIIQPADQVRGYLAGPLDGIWARAPYLHNGSVPTLKALLLPATRPATFARGSLNYDKVNVGFAWDANALKEPNVHVFNTAEAGGSNVGHSTAKFNGQDWSKKPKELEALLEFMKTL